MRYLCFMVFSIVLFGIVGCNCCKSDNEYELTDSTMAAIDSICEDLAKVDSNAYPKRKYIIPKRLAEECRKHTMEMMKSDSEMLARGELDINPYEERKGTIEEVCNWIEKNWLSDEEIAELDANDGEMLLIRNAERSLDTIVNHQRIIFTIKR